MGARLMDRVGDGRRALTRRRPWNQAVRTARAPRIGDLARHRTRIRSQEPWPRGRAVGAGAVEGACTQVMHRRVKRAGRRWTPPGLLHVLAGRSARRHGTFQACWASRGRVFQASV
jgi:hypothetical protein